MFPEALQAWPLVAVALAVSALLLLALAIRTGRWGLWLAGYGLVLLAITAAIIANRGREADPGAGPDDVQPSPVSGVLPGVWREPRSGEVA
jgi:hypothetical protein